MRVRTLSAESEKFFCNSLSFASCSAWLCVDDPVEVELGGGVVVFDEPEPKNDSNDRCSRTTPNSASGFGGDAEGTFVEKESPPENTASAAIPMMSTARNRAF